MSEHAARQTIEAYVKAFNAQDVPAMVDKLNFPFCWIINNKVRPVAKAEDFVPPTIALKEREGWHHTDIDRLEPFQVWDTKAHFRVVYGRFRADDTRYTTHDALWIVTADQGHWGIQCMSLYIP